MQRLYIHGNNARKPNKISAAKPIPTNETPRDMSKHNKKQTRWNKKPAGLSMWSMGNGKALTSSGWS
jgi:hypothetical protein